MGSDRRRTRELKGTRGGPLEGQMGSGGPHKPRGADAGEAGREVAGSSERLLGNRRRAEGVVWGLCVSALGQASQDRVLASETRRPEAIPKVIAAGCTAHSKTYVQNIGRDLFQEEIKNPNGEMDKSHEQVVLVLKDVPMTHTWGKMPSLTSNEKVQVRARTTWFSHSSD